MIAEDLSDYSYLDTQMHMCVYIYQMDPYVLAVVSRLLFYRRIGFIVFSFLNLLECYLVVI